MSGQGCSFWSSDDDSDSPYCMSFNLDKKHLYDEEFYENESNVHQVTEIEPKDDFGAESGRKFELPTHTSRKVDFGPHTFEEAVRLITIATTESVMKSLKDILPKTFNNSKRRRPIDSSDEEKETSKKIPATRIDTMDSSDDDTDKVEKKTPTKKQKSKETEKVKEKVVKRKKKSHKKRRPSSDEEDKKTEETKDISTDDEDVKLINKTLQEVPEFKSLRDLTNGKWYRISLFELTDTKKGERVRLTLKDGEFRLGSCYVYLPGRLNEKLVPLLDKFNKKCGTKKPLHIQYNGISGKTFNLKFDTKQI